MGNELTTLVPREIIPVEEYLQDVRFTKSLSSTRFLKTALVQDDSRKHHIAKVFAIHNNTPEIREKLKSTQIELTRLRTNLANCPNCLPYKTDKLQLQNDDNSAQTSDNLQYAVVFREYHASTLTDALSMDLSKIEQFWLIFQMLKACEQAHNNGIVHGDIKLDNILLNQWNWLYLSDFSCPFKPAKLPLNDPSIFNFYYDSSSRRTCNVAPERFKSQITDENSSNSQNSTSKNKNPQNSNSQNYPQKSSKLHPSVDIFSLGCCISQFITGEPLFTFSSLLNYKKNKIYPDEKLSKIPNQNLKKLVKSMTSLDPSVRNSASFWLAEYKEILFPDYFYTDLFSIAHEKWLNWQKFSKNDLENLNNSIDLCGGANVGSTDGSFDIYGVMVDYVICNKNMSKTERLTSLSWIMESYGSVMTGSGQNSEVDSQFVLTDRILPNLVHTLADDRKSNSQNIRTKVDALRLMSKCLKMIKTPKSEKNLPIIDLIITNIISILNKKESAKLMLRQTLAVTIGEILSSISKIVDSSTIEIYGFQLENCFRDCDGVFITDKNESVRRLFLKNSLRLMAETFPAETFPELHKYLFDMLFTFLGSENNWTLKRDVLLAFPDVKKPLEILKTFLEEAFLDVSEKVIEASLSTILAIFINQETAGTSKYRVVL